MRHQIWSTFIIITHDRSNGRNHHHHPLLIMVNKKKLNLPSCDLISVIATIFFSMYRFQNKAKQKYCGLHQCSINLPHYTSYILLVLKQLVLYYAIVHTSFLCNESFLILVLWSFVLKLCLLFRLIIDCILHSVEKVTLTERFRAVLRPMTR